MRVTTSPQTPVARTSETQSTVAKPAVESKVSSTVKNLGHSIVDGGCFPPRPTPFPTPFPPFPPFPRPGADKQAQTTQGKQLHEVAQGVRNGSITAQESEQLLKEQKAIADATKQAMSDGKLSLGERFKLGLMQARAEQHIQQAAHNGSRDLGAMLGFDQDASRQAAQIDRLANGRTSGNVTNTEASELLGQQVDVADARGDADSVAENAEVDRKLDAADREISRHALPGTQLDFKPFPLPLPLPRPELPRPFPLPRPELPRPFPLPRVELPTKPVFEALPFLKGTTNV